jgi:cytochrome P450
MTEMDWTESFDHNTERFVEDPFSIYQMLRDECPVAHSDRHDEFWVLTRYEDVRKALLDWKTFTSSIPGTVAIPHTRSTGETPMLPLESDPPQHTQYRQAVARYFARPSVERIEPRVKEAANNIIDTFVERGRCELVKEYAEPLVSRALATFLKLPLEDTALWIEWADAIFAGRYEDPEAAREAREQLSAYVDRLMAERKREPADDVFTALVQAEVDGRPLSDGELRGYGMEILLAGREATIDGIVNSLHYLALHPEARQRLIDEPALMRTAVDELLRYNSPIQLLGRIATRDVEIRGQTIREGESVAVTYGSANRDERVFEEAEQCLLDRSPNPHVAFGAGPHGCVGAHLARLDMRVAIGEWLRRIPDYQLVDGGEMKANGDARGFRRLPVTFAA